MSLQEEEKEIANLKQKIHSIESPLQDYYSNVFSSSFNPPRKKDSRIPSSNLDNQINRNYTIIKTMKEIKYNFMEEHKNIINTYYSVYSKRLDDIICYNLNNVMDVEKKYSEVNQKINQNLIDNQANTTKIINDIVDSNIDTFIKSIDLAHKFYSNVIESYCNYIRNCKVLE